ncbi:hypothetical protein BBJ28_00015578 [Nothophytophthora sp. Chile5]|nr:hypothetical protein BBJ28_00015578 [Nothophytophthora sp. Chile5]
MWAMDTYQTNREVEGGVCDVGQRRYHQPEQFGKLKETEAFKKSSTLASGAYERTSVVASGALEKVGRLICCAMAYCDVRMEVLAIEVLTLLASSLCRCLQARAASTTGLEMAKHTAAAGYETLKSKTGGKKGGE